MKKTPIVLGIIIVIVIALVVALLRPANGPSPAVAVVPFTPLAQGSESAVTSRVNYLITSQDQLNELWGFLDQPPPIPSINFNTNVVIAIFGGEFPTTGYSVAVAEVVDGDSRLVKVELAKPDQSCVLAQSTTTPYQVVELPKTSLPFTHDDMWTTTACP
jgi:hypothetical protein